MLETITTHIEIEKLNERGKKNVKCKIRAPLDKTSYTSVWGLYLYIYIDVSFICKYIFKYRWPLENMNLGKKKKKKLRERERSKLIESKK